ncbi:LAMI_0H08966g1_1 [Lachancea mirantina]|uniref:Maintenance of mitochondrial morphology protein 1 n=1 Tax=Lachancea mirantina TaxID=1230905 RepID=A0A1G4KGA4_9SACH|nr:LAMI_0H08966g1_1 [Lachancea mirantina]
MTETHAKDNGSTSANGFEKETSVASNETLVSLDDYINNALASHMQQFFTGNMQSLGNNNIGHSTNSSSLILSRDLGMDTILDRLKNDGIIAEAGNARQSQQSSFSAWSFAEGLIVGQASVILVLIFFIKFFIFSEGPLKNERSDASMSNANSNKSAFSAPPLISTTTSQFLSSIIKRRDDSQFKNAEENDMRFSLINSILEKTYYNVDTHAPESLDWFNVLIAQAIQQIRQEALQKDNIVHFLNDLVSRKSQEFPRYLDTIKITELDIGEDFPIFSNCRIQYSPNSNKKRLEAKIDIDLRDKLTLGFETKLLMNYPKAFTAALPVQLTVSIVRFQACLTVSLTTEEEFSSTSNGAFDSSDGVSAYFLMFSFSPEYKMDFDIKSLIGARSKLQNIPKISLLIESQIKRWFVERCVEPRFQFVRLPSMWPRSKNTREEKSESEDAPAKAADFMPS